MTLSLPEKRFIVFVCGWVSELVVAIVVAALSLIGGKKHFWMFEVEMKGRMRSENVFLLLST